MSSTASSLAGYANNTNPIWWKDAGLRGLMWRCVVLLGGQYINGFDGALMNSLLSNPSFLDSMGHPDSNTLGLMEGAISLGYLVSLVPASIASDKFGRKLPAVFGCIFVIIGTLVIVLKYDNPWTFFGGRMIIGFGGAFPMIAGSSHVLEVAHPRHAQGLSSAFFCIYSLGAIIASWMAFGCLYWANTTWSWRLPALFQMFAAIVQLATMYWIPESPRWLVSVGRTDEAHALLAQWHANGDTDDELVRMELAEIQETIRISQSEDAKPKWIDWVKTKGNRHRLFIAVFNAIISQWAGTGIFSFYLAPILESVGINGAAQQQGINGGINIMLLAAAVPLITYLERFRRRYMYLGGTVFMLACYSVVTACSAVYSETGNVAAGKAVVAFIYLFQLGNLVGYGALYYAYMTPLLPTSMRTQGVALSLIVGYAMAFFNQYCNPIAFDSIGWRYYVVYLVLLVVYFFLLYLFFPETRGLTSEEQSVLLDGKDATARVKQAGAAAADHKGHQIEVIVGSEVNPTKTTLPMDEKV